MTINEQYLDSAIRAVSEACKATRAVQAELESIRQMTKDDRSPVTVADFAAQAIVCQRLHDDLGAIDMVGEESAAEIREPGKETLAEAVAQTVQKYRPDLDDEAALSAIDIGNHDASNSSYWTLDPIDGTKGFLRGGQYAVSLAFIENGEVTLGVLGCPNMSADLRLPTHAGYVEKIWDHAAGKLIAEQAGAVVTDVYGNALDFSTGATLQSNKGVICTAASIHADIIAAISSLGIAP